MCLRAELRYCLRLGVVCHPISARCYRILNRRKLKGNRSLLIRHDLSRDFSINAFVLRRLEVWLPTGNSCDGKFANTCIAAFVFLFVCAWASKAFGTSHATVGSRTVLYICWDDRRLGLVELCCICFVMFIQHPWIQRGAVLPRRFRWSLLLKRQSLFSSVHGMICEIC